MAFPGRHYAPPNPYTQTDYQNPLQGAIESLKIPVFIGEGNEFLSQIDLEVVRGSSATVDQRVVGEDMTGRAIVSVSATGVVTRGSFDGALNEVQVRNLPIVTGDGTGTTSNSRSDVNVTINGLPVVVLQVTGTTGIIKLAQAPKLGDQVRISYYFNREDTLITDDVSDQVTAENAIIRATVGLKDVNAPTPGTDVLDLHADILGATGAVVVPANNVLNLIVDGSQYSITLPPKTDYTMQQVANVISAAGVGTLTGSTFVNNFGESTLALNADHDLTVLEGTANALLGLAAGQVSARRKTFYTFHGPIVDGSNGGVTTTDPSHVVVKVNGTQVIPESVDGATRAITLTQAPKAGATVTVTYWFNTWQDTYDHLAHVNVQSLTRVGDVPGGSQYIQGADFVLQDDKVMWGTAALVTAGTTTTGSELFNDTQITPTLIDNKTFMSECSSVAGSVRDFQLPLNPTLGNGRDTSLGQSLFQSVSNNKIGVPVNRPDVVDVYWGFSVDDALARGKVTVVKVEGSVVTLQDAVPVGATVYATFYHNMIVDMEYTLACVLPGVSGVGTYTIQDSGGNAVFTPSFDNSTKSAGLTGVEIVFPSGSELTPDLHFEGGSGTDFQGPVEEIVTVTFANTTDTPAKFTVAGAAPYAFIPGESDLVAMTINGDTVLPVAGTDLDNISTGGGGIMAHLVGNEVEYPDGVDFDLADFEEGNEDILLTVDGVQINAVVEAAANVTVSNIAAAINSAANGELGVADANFGAGDAGVASLTDAGLLHMGVTDYYVGWYVVIGNHAVGGAPTPGSIATVISQDGANDYLVVDGNWPGGPMAATVPYRIYNPEAVSTLKGATKFTGTVDLSNAGGPLTTSVAVTTDNNAATTITASITNTTYASATLLATALNTAFRGASGNDLTTKPAAGSPIDLATAGTPALEGLDFLFTADSDGRIQVQLQLPGLDAGGFLEFVQQGAPPAATDLAVLMGFDVSTANGQQAKLLVADIAKPYRVSPTAPASVYPHDRVILRNRIHPGGVSMSALDVVNQCGLVVGAGNGNTKAGLSNGMYGEASWGATVLPATLLANVGYGGGSSDDGEAEVTFYDGTGSQPANDQFEFVIDGQPIKVDFEGSATGTTRELGYISAAGSVIRYIQQALADNGTWGNLAAVQATNLVQYEGGASFRLNSQGYHVAHTITIGGGSANSVLGLTEGTVAARTLVTAEVLASALNSDRESSLVDFLVDFTAIGAAAQEFAAQAVAQVIQDEAARKYLHIASAGPADTDYGTGSTIVLLDANTRSWLFVGTGIDELDSAGAVGEAGVNGFFVTSSDASDGSGSIDDSILNSGTGQDGRIGQTYRDSVTGLTFTILPRGWHDNQAGPWVAYPDGATFQFQVSKTVTTDANLPIRVIPGIELLVANTSNVGVGDTAIVTTYPRGGEEPAIGDLYYASYVYQKQDYTTAFFTRMQSLFDAYGTVHPDNPVSLAAYLAAINGAVLVGIKQVPRAENSQFADTATYLAAITELEGVLPGQIKPDMIQPLKGDSTQLFQLLARSNAIQSSIRYRSERTSIIGVAAGTTEEAAKVLARTLGDDRMRLVYPDMALMNIEDEFGVSKEHLIDGPMLAAMLAGSVVSPNYDVASPWTRRKLIGPSQLARTLDAVQQNQLAVAGITVLADKPPFISVRHGLTTDMTNILTKTPTVRLIADHVQQQSRATLDPFIGQKFLPGILSQIEGRLAKMMQTLVKQDIIAIYTGLKAVVDPEDPTTANVEAYYQPVFPLLYIVLSFHLRASL
jgi:hypothetical protein